MVFPVNRFHLLKELTCLGVFSVTKKDLPVFWDSKEFRYIFKDDEPNPVKSLALDDLEYIAWSKEHPVYPNIKQRGKFPLFAFGAVGKNMKSGLHVFEKSFNVNRNHYFEAIKKEIVDKKDYYISQMKPIKIPGRIFPIYPSMHITEDNDPKHTYFSPFKLIESQLLY